MEKVRKWLAWLNPLARKRAKRLAQYLEFETHKMRGAIELHRKVHDEKQRQMELELHREQREASNWLQNREMRMLEITLEYNRALIDAHIDTRRHLASECPELLSDAELSKLEVTMLRPVRISRQARRDDYERRADAAGVPVRRPAHRDAAAYGDLEALVRREVRQLALDDSLRRITRQGEWTRDQKLKLAGWVSALVAVLLLLMNLVGLDRLRHWLNLG